MMKEREERRKETHREKWRYMFYMVMQVDSSVYYSQRGVYVAMRRLSGRNLGAIKGVHTEKDRVWGYI